VVVAPSADIEPGGRAPQQRAGEAGRKGTLDRQRLDDDLALQAGEVEVIGRAIRGGAYGHAKPLRRSSMAW
jgi:hypothetical protein